jgi:hypothetical protein
MPHQHDLYRRGKLNVDNIRRDDWILGGLALLLVIDLVALPWFSIGGGSVAGVSLPSVDLTGTDAPDGWLGILGVIAALALIADLTIERMSPQTAVPAIGDSREMTRFVLAAAAAAFVALKFVFHISASFNNLGLGFPIAIVLAAGLLFFALQARQPGPVVPAVPPTTPAGAAEPAGSSGPPVA